MADTASNNFMSSFLPPGLLADVRQPFLIEPGVTNTSPQGASAKSEISPEVALAVSQASDQLARLRDIANKLGDKTPPDIMAALQNGGNAISGALASNNVMSLSSLNLSGAIDLGVAAEDRAEQEQQDEVQDIIAAELQTQQRDDELNRDYMSRDYPANREMTQWIDDAYAKDPVMQRFMDGSFGQEGIALANHNADPEMRQTVQTMATLEKAAPGLHQDIEAHKAISKEDFKTLFTEESANHLHEDDSKVRNDPTLSEEERTKRLQVIKDFNDEAKTFEQRFKEMGLTDSVEAHKFMRELKAGEFNDKDGVAGSGLQNATARMKVLETHGADMAAQAQKFANGSMNEEEKALLHRVEGSNAETTPNLKDAAERLHVDGDALTEKMANSKDSKETYKTLSDNEKAFVLQRRREATEIGAKGALNGMNHVRDMITHGELSQERFAQIEALPPKERADAVSGLFKGMNAADLSPQMQGFVSSLQNQASGMSDEARGAFATSLLEAAKNNDVSGYMGGLGKAFNVNADGSNVDNVIAVQTQKAEALAAAHGRSPGTQEASAKPADGRFQSAEAHTPEGGFVPPPASNLSPQRSQQRLVGA